MGCDIEGSGGGGSAGTRPLFGVYFGTARDSDSGSSVGSGPALAVETAAWMVTGHASLLAFELAGDSKSGQVYEYPLLSSFAGLAGPYAVTAQVLNTGAWQAEVAFDGGAALTVQLTPDASWAQGTVSTLRGEYSGGLLHGPQATFAFDGQGGFVGTDSAGCSYVGGMAPIASKNLYAIVLDACGSYAVEGLATVTPGTADEPAELFFVGTSAAFGWGGRLEEVR